MPQEKQTKKSRPTISKGYSQVKANDKKLGTNRDCRRCRFDIFGECSNREASVHDVVREFGREYCQFFEERT